MTSLALALALTPGTVFRPDAFGDFQNWTFGGIALGATTDADLKRMFKTGKGAIRPEGLRLDAGSELRVDVLLDGRGGEAKVVGIRMLYAQPQERHSLLGRLSGGKFGYASRRYSDWQVATYPEKGVAALITDGKVEAVVVSTPARIKAISERLQPDPPKVADLKGTWKSRSAAVGISSATLGFSSMDLAVRNPGAEQRVLQFYFMRSIAGGHIRMGGTGSAHASVSVENNSVSVSVDLYGENDFGGVSIAGGGSNSFSANDEKGTYDQNKVTSAIDSAISSLNSQLEDQERSKPPTEKGSG